MAVPTKKQFKEHVTACESFVQRVLSDIGMELIEVGGNYQNLLELVEKIQAKNIALDDAMDKMPVAKWLAKQPSFIRFERVVWGKGPFGEIPPGSVVAERMYTHAMKPKTMEDSFNTGRHPHLLRRYPTAREQALYIELLNSPEEKEKRLDRALRMWAFFNPYTLYGRIAQALHDYHYADRASELAADAKQQADAARKVLSAMEVLLGAGGYGFLPVQRLNRSRTLMHSVKEELEAFQANALQSVSPIRRLDGTAKERALAYDLWVALSRKLRRNSTQAIFYLMELEGIENPQGLRALERMVADWAKERTRQLEREKLTLSAGVNTRPINQG